MPSDGSEVVVGERKRAARRWVVRFLVLFAVWIGVGHVLLTIAPVERGFVEPWTAANIATAVRLAAVLGIDATAEGTQMRAGQHPLDVEKGCDGTSALVILVSAMLGFPASWRARVGGLVLGVGIVFVVNAFRLATLLWVAVHWPTRLEFFHVDLWQPAMMVVAFGTFLAWGMLMARDSARRLMGASPGDVA